MLPPLRYIVPVHNDEPTLDRSVRMLVDELSRRSPSRDVHRILLVENGSRDRSFAVARSLEGVRDGVHVHAFTEPSAGIGHAYDRGMREALALGGDAISTWHVLTASDLPFGFSDLDEFEKWNASGPSGRMVAGSKAHPDSQLRVTRLRATMTLVYRLARRAIIGMRTGDSQGSFFVRADLARELLPKIVARDFFYTTEMVYYAERARETITELPIRVVPEVRPSTVRPLKHGSHMLRALLELRARSL